MIVLVACNARYQHPAFGLRWLLANLGELRAQAVLREYTLDTPPSQMAEEILALAPRLVALSVYVWNVAPLTHLAGLLKRLRPELILVVGGPEVSHEWREQPLAALADHVVTGEGEVAFRELCRTRLAGGPAPPVVHAAPPELAGLTLPYALYSDTDLAQRVIYVESSRGCPYRCAFCLSALDRQVRLFPLAPLLAALDDLWQRGARRFKFVDRTFNLNVARCRAILEYFLARPGSFVHFELMPDHLNQALRTLLPRFAPGAVQLEVGVQSWQPEVLARIGRRQQPERAVEHLTWLKSHTGAHLHTDLIVGLPGEDLDQFGAGFDRLVALAPHEIQVGILKRLRGAPLTALQGEYGMVFNPAPPYDLLANGLIDFPALQEMKRFARHWDQVANSGRFAHSLPLLLGEAPFVRFRAFSRWLGERSGGGPGIALGRLFDLVETGLGERLGVDGAKAAVAADRLAHDRRGKGHALPSRQQRHWA